jgi:hypothetical protein
VSEPDFLLWAIDSSVVRQQKNRETDWHGHGQLPSGMGKPTHCFQILARALDTTEFREVDSSGRER